jgi:predicted CXXCH cytochrome family protein
MSAIETETNLTTKLVAVNRILFAADFSCQSSVALPYVLALARRYEAKVFLAHVVPTENYVLVSPETGAEWLEEAALQAREQLDELSGQFEEIKDQSKGDLTYAQAYFFQVPKVRWLHNSLLKQSEPEACYTCHRTIEAQFALPVHHRVPEGLMKCTDCHSPHSSLNRASLNRPYWESCVKCHVEKRGPYVFEHPAVKVEGCVICHNPHGNTNRMLLVRREGRQLCLQCHTAFHGQLGVPHGRLGFAPGGECVRCHVAVHGSNWDVNFLR